MSHPISSDKGKKFSTNELRDFYFSKATNYTSYKTKQEGSAERDRIATPTDVTLSINKTSPKKTAAAASEAKKVVPSPLTAYTPASEQRVDATGMSIVASEAHSPSAVATVPAPNGTVVAAKKGQQPQAPPAPSTTSKIPAGSAVSVARNNNSALTLNSTVNGDAVSPEYINFLRHQQDLVKTHGHVDETLQHFLDDLVEHRKRQQNYVDVADQLLRGAEASTDWNWKSKFNVDVLSKDASFVVPLSDLKYHEDIPNIVDLQHQQQQLIKLKQAHCSSEKSSSDFKVTLENGVRRFDRLIKEFTTSQLNAEPLVRTSDDLLVQLDYVLSQFELNITLQDINDTIAAISEKQRDCMAVRDQAHEDGEMNVAERETYRLADLSEELANSQVEKIRLLSRLRDDSQVNLAVRDSYAKKAQDETSKIENESSDLKNRCEADLARLFQLKKQVDDAEGQMRARTEQERGASDHRIATLTRRQEEAWEQIVLLVKQVRQLELERHHEVKKRVEEKVKDETRRNEYNAFSNVADYQGTNYDRTIKNCDTYIHCTKLMAEFLQSGFFSIQKKLTLGNKEISDGLLDAQKVHLETFRTLLFTLGDLEYKKERRVEEVGQSIQAAHIQQEMCSDSLNPNAKKFSDAKKDLLRIRDEIELELRDIRDRQSASLNQYKPTEIALVQASVVHTHPLDDLQERRLSTRARMVEYKAMSLGHVTSAPIRQELDQLKAALQESRRVISRTSNRSGTN